MIIIIIITIVVFTMAERERKKNNQKQQKQPIIILDKASITELNLTQKKRTHRIRQFKIGRAIFNRFRSIKFFFRIVECV